MVHLANSETAGHSVLVGGTNEDTNNLRDTRPGYDTASVTHPDVSDQLKFGAMGRTTFRIVVMLSLVQLQTKSPSHTHC